MKVLVPLFVGVLLLLGVPFFVVACILDGGVDRKEEARLKALVSSEVLAVLDEYRSSKGRYPESLRDIGDGRLAALQKEGHIRYSAESDGRAFQFAFPRPGSGGEWDIRSDRRSWSLDR